MKYGFNILKYFFVFFTLTSILISCKKTDSPKYAIWFQTGNWPEGKYFLSGTNTLTEGEIYFKNSVAINDKTDYSIVPHQGFYYFPGTSKGLGKMSKYVLKDNVFELVKEVPFTYQNNIRNYTIINDTTLLFIGSNENQNKIRYTLLTTSTLAMVNGEFDIPYPENSKDLLLLDGHVIYRDDSIFITYAYLGDFPEIGCDAIGLAEIQFPEMKVINVQEDSRNTMFGGANIWKSNSGIDDDGTIFFLFRPHWMYDTNKYPSGLYKVNKGEYTFDSSYFFNLSTLLGGVATGFWSAGNGKAIVKYQMSKSEEIDYDKTYFHSYALIDLKKEILIKKFTDIPYDMGNQTNTVLIKNNKVHIIVNSFKGEDYVWQYDFKSDSLTKGVKIKGSYDFLLRLDLID